MQIYKIKIIILLILFKNLFIFNSSYSQQIISIDLNTKYQTIKGFGASDAWNCDYVGKYWNDSIKEKIAELLFSKDFDNQGNPIGIGLSRWRFNIGAGSFEQGNLSNIELVERRVECFLNQDGTYDWNKQLGQQYFLKKALEYGVEELVAFINSPPIFFTKNGRANSDNKLKGGSTNLKDSYYSKYVNFITDILVHFANEGITFSQVSPINEPQYEWNKGQEGCPWQNHEIKKLIYVLDSTLNSKNLPTKILFPEAATYYDLYKINNNLNTSNQIQEFFDKESKLYCGNLKKLLNGICCHSYFTDYNDDLIRQARTNAWNIANKYEIELYQTEYSLLSRHFNTKIENSLFLAKMIYADLTIANVSIWDFWTALERERWNHLNRFYLIRLIPSEGDYGDLTKGGTIEIDKNLWVLGNFSRFIRPGYKRIKLIGAEDLSSFMGTAFISNDLKQLIVVLINYSFDSKFIKLRINNNYNNCIKINSITGYITDSQLNLQKQKINKNKIKIPSKSVVTIVIDLY